MFSQFFAFCSGYSVVFFFLCAFSHHHVFKMFARIFMKAGVTHSAAVCVCVELRDSETPAGQAHWDREHVLRAQTRQTNGSLQAALTHHLPPPPQPDPVGQFPAFTFPV